MHQSVRMVVALFLTEYLNFHWVLGARWFHDTLVDADLAINSMMWQNAGKSGLDQWDFTVSPSSKLSDPKGRYIRQCGLLLWSLTTISFRLTDVTYNVGICLPSFLFRCWLYMAGVLCQLDSKPSFKCALYSTCFRLKAVFYSCQPTSLCYHESLLCFCGTVEMHTSPHAGLSNECIYTGLCRLDA